MPFSDLLNFVLVFSAGIASILIWLLVRQRARIPAMSIFTYLVFLLLLDILGVLFLANSGAGPDPALIARARIILHIFTLAILYYFVDRFTLTRNFQGPAPRHAVLLVVALLLSLMHYFQTPLLMGRSFPAGSMLTLVFYTGVLALLGREVYVHRNDSRMPLPDRMSGGQMQMFLIITGVVMAALYVCALFEPMPRFIYLLYSVLSAVVFFNSLRFRLIDINDRTRYLIPQIGVSGFFLLIFFATFERVSEIEVVYMSIPVFLALTYVGYSIQLYTTLVFRRARMGYYELLDSRMSRFNTRIVQIMDTGELWGYLRTFFNETFGFSRCAAVVVQYDVSPYLLAYNHGFEESDIHSLISDTGSSLMATIEEQKPLVINRFDYTAQTEIFQQMEAQTLYIVLPLIQRKSLLGILFLGDHRHYSRVPRRHLQLLTVVSAQISITLQKIKTVADIVQSQKLASLGMLTSQLAHDFRSFVSLVKLNNSENERIVRHAGYMEKMVQDLLNYARPQELKRSRVQVNQLLEMCLDMVEVPSTIQVERHFGADLPGISLDVNQMRRVFTNLIANSVRAVQTNGGCRIKLTTRALKPKGPRSRVPWIYIEILDDGVGIPQEFLTRIFEPFFTTHKKQGGNGLGLAIVHQIIERHSGHVEASSNPGKGTVFSIRLPYQPL